MWIKYGTVVNMIFRLEMAQHDNIPEHNQKMGV
jgi:hypothetical protein